MRNWRCFGWTKRTDQITLGGVHKELCQIVDLLRGRERQKHVLEHARKQNHKNFSHYFRIILKSLDRARALICFSEVILPQRPFFQTLQHI